MAEDQLTQELLQRSFEMGAHAAATAAHGATGAVVGTTNVQRLTNKKFGGAADYSEFESDGFMKHTGGAKYWVDIDFPIIIRTTGAGIPTLATLNGNLTAPKWAVNDFNQCESQELIHPWDEGSTVYWHIHLTTGAQDATERFVRLEVEYGYVTPNGQWVFPATLNTGDISIAANTPAKTMLIMSLGSFTPAVVKIGGHVVARLKRIASTGAAPSVNPFIPMLQLHVLCDSEGSREISSK